MKTHCDSHSQKVNTEEEDRLQSKQSFRNQQSGYMLDWH